MSNEHAFFTCKLPNSDVSSMYTCVPCDEGMADLVWGDYASESVRYFRRERLNNPPEKTTCDTLPLPEDAFAIDKTEYVRLVDRARKTIAVSHAKKIVLSRSQIINLPDDFDALTFYDKLCKAFPSAFVYLFNAEGTCWMGATPELLLNQEGRHILTMSLAGTRWANEGKHADWTEKEREEQAWVTTFLREELAALGIQRIKEFGPRTLQAAHLQHLCTELKGDLPHGVSPLQSARRLHPTPAVCGYPRDIAHEFIQKNEMHQRGYYAGYIGVVEGNQSHFYVNLRCMQVFDKQAMLFAGGGITADSDSEIEWEETEQKLDVLRQLINT